MESNQFMEQKMEKINGDPVSPSSELWISKSIGIIGNINQRNFEIDKLSCCDGLCFMQ